MSNPFVGEVRIWSLNFAPRGWAECNGQLLPISQNTALFSILGTTYGGNGTSNFALPNLQGMAPMHPGQGPGLSLYDLGETGGSQTVTLIQGQMPQHTHALQVREGGTTTNAPSAAVVLGNAAPSRVYLPATPVNTTLSAASITVAGGSQSHENMQPYLTLTINIALQGIFPSRN